MRNRACAAHGKRTLGNNADGEGISMLGTFDSTSNRAWSASVLGEIEVKWQWILAAPCQSRNCRRRCAKRNQDACQRGTRAIELHATTRMESYLTMGA